MNLQARLPEIPPKLVRLPAFTYTWGNTYRNICPHQAYRRYILKDIPYVSTPALEVGNEIHSALENRVGKSKPLPEKYQQYETFASVFDGIPVKCELKLALTADGRACDYFSPKVFVRGKADVALVQGESGYLADYKSGRVREDPFELEVQAMLLHGAFPQLKQIKAQYIWLKEMRVGQIHDVSRTTQTWQTVCETVLEAQHDLEQGSFQKRQGPLCRFCDVANCEFNLKGK